MKILLSLTIIATFLITACSTPEERQRAAAAERQRKLHEEARERFEEQKEKERDRAEEVADARRHAAEDARDRAEEVADARRRAAEDATRYRAYEVEYARQLGKKPSQLTPAERQWVREHF